MPLRAIEILRPTVRLLRPVACVVALALLYGCSARPAPYAQAYRQALDEIQGTADVTIRMTARFVDFFSHSADPPHAGLDPADLYGSPLYFSDTLLTTRDRDAALKHLRSMRDGARSLQVTVLDQQIDGQDAYVVWRMRAEIEPGFSTVMSDSVGVTHLRFDEDGGIILQQDFWDSAEGLYRHVPVLGRLVIAVRSRFEAGNE